MIILILPVVRGVAVIFVLSPILLDLVIKHLIKYRFFSQKNNITLQLLVKNAIRLNSST